MGKYLIESTDKSVAKNGKEYIRLNVRDLKNKFSIFVWDAPFIDKDGSKVMDEYSDLVGNVLSFNYMKDDKYPTLKSALIRPNVSSYDELEEDSPLRKIQVIGNVSMQGLIDKINEVASHLIEGSWLELIQNFPWKTIFEDGDDTPAGLKVHHSFKGGLFEHIWEILDMYQHITESKVFKDHRHEFVILGICFHDWGKIKEYDTEKWEVTEEHSLLGHMYLGARMLEKTLSWYRKKNEFPVKTDIDRAVHCVLAHHRQLDWGSPVMPATKEAMTVHFLDEMSGKMNMYKNSVNMERNFWLNTNTITE